MTTSLRWVFAGAALSTVIVAGMQVDASFEVASVRESNSAEGGKIQVGPGAITANGATVRQLIVRGYRVQDFQIVGEPGWVNSARFDIAARMPESTTPDQLASMIRSLLKDRFDLRAHMATTDLPVYVLALARKDGKLGPQMKPSEVDCDAIAEEAQARGGAPPPTPAGQAPPCSIGFTRGRMSSRSKPIADLLTFFSQVTGRTVVDRTGLKGGFDIDLNWAPDLPALPLEDGIVVQSDSSGPSIFTAVQEQLGLKLETSKALLPALVIDQISLPTEN